MLKRFELDNITPRKTPMDPHKKIIANKGEVASKQFTKRYQALVGSANYLSIVSRPDISYVVGKWARYMANPSEEHMEGLIWLYGYLKSSIHHGIYLDGKAPQGIHGMVDSDYGGCLDTYRSTTGWVFFAAGAPIS